MSPTPSSDRGPVTPHQRPPHQQQPAQDRSHSAPDAASAVGTRRQSYAPGAYAIVKSDPPQLFLADNAQVMSRLIAVKVVAPADPAIFGSFRVSLVRQALLEERWVDAVVTWMDATGVDIDVYEEYVPVWTEEDLNAELASMEIRMSRIFEQ